METVLPPAAVTEAARAQSEAVGGSDVVPAGRCAPRYVRTTDEQLSSARSPGRGQPRCRAATPMPGNT